MNCKPNGQLLTTEDLWTIASNHGLATETVRNRIRHLHNENLEMSALTQLTANVRFAMMMNGELILNTAGLVPFKPQEG